MIGILITLAVGTSVSLSIATISPVAKMLCIERLPAAESQSRVGKRFDERSLRSVEVIHFGFDSPSSTINGTNRTAPRSVDVISAPCFAQASQMLVLDGPDRNHHPAIGIRELIEQGERQRTRARGHHDRVVGRSRFPARGSVANDGRDIGDTERRKPIGCRFRKLLGCVRS